MGPGSSLRCARDDSWISGTSYWRRLREPSRSRHSPVGEVWNASPACLRRLHAGRHRRHRPARCRAAGLGSRGHRVAAALRAEGHRGQDDPRQGAAARLRDLRQPAGILPEPAAPAFPGAVRHRCRIRVPAGALHRPPGRQPGQGAGGVHPGRPVLFGRRYAGIQPPPRLHADAERREDARSLRQTAGFR